MFVTGDTAEPRILVCQDGSRSSSAEVDLSTRDYGIYGCVWKWHLAMAVKIWLWINTYKYHF